MAEMKHDIVRIACVTVDLPPVQQAVAAGFRHASLDHTFTLPRAMIDIEEADLRGFVFVDLPRWKANELGITEDLLRWVLI